MPARAGEKPRGNFVRASYRAEIRALEAIRTRLDVDGLDVLAVVVLDCEPALVRHGCDAKMAMSAGRAEGNVPAIECSAFIRDYLIRS
jgi:hypothetical protein